MGELTLVFWVPAPQPLHPALPALRFHLRAASCLLAAPPVMAPNAPSPSVTSGARGESIRLGDLVGGR